MNVVVVNPSYPPVRCGVGDYTRRLAEALTAGGERTTVVTSALPQIEAVPHVLPLIEDWTVAEFARRHRRIASLRPDVVICEYPAVMPGSHSRLMYLFPLLAKASLGRPRVIFVVHEYAATANARSLHVAFRFADDIVAVDERDATAIIAALPRLAEKVRVVPIGSNIPRVDLSPGDALATRAELGSPLVMFFGLLTSPAKGFDDLLEALAQLDGPGLLATGRIEASDPYHAQVASTIDRLGIAPRVRWLGHLPDVEVARLLRAVDVVALPFRDGAAAKNGTLVAAIVNGAAIVTTTGDGNPPWLRDGETALLVPASRPPALAAAIDRVVKSPALRAKLAARAGALAPRFDWRRVATDVLGVQTPA